MAEYANHLGLYKPNRQDDIPIDDSLASNFSEIDRKLGDALQSADGETHSSLGERLEKELGGQNNQADDSAYIQDIQVEYRRDNISQTDYTLTRIKATDSNGDMIRPKRGFINGDPNTQTLGVARDFANKNNTSVAINASTFTVGATTRRSADIYEGVSYSGNPVYQRWELGVLPDNTLKAYPPRTPAQELIDDGVIYSFAGFCPFIIDGEEALSDYYIGVSANSYEQHPRNAIGQFANKDFIILTAEGRSNRNAGMTIEDMARILHSEGVQFAYNLDGGGSTQTVVRGTQINNNFDADGERDVVDFLYFGKEAKTARDLDIRNAYKDIGEVNRKVQQLDTDLSDMGQLTDWVNQNTIPDSLDDIKVSGFYWGHATGTTGTPPSPSGISWGVIHFQYDKNSAMQIAFPFHSSNGAINVRRTSSSGFGAWRTL